jgi:glycosyltransferase involved in cell wall biosynthesis
MKIALTIDSFVEGQGGVSTAVAALARNLRKRGHEVIVYTAADPSHKQSDLDVVGLRALRYERFPGGRAPMAPISLVQELADFHPDAIHNHSMGTMGLQALAAAHLLGIPILGTCHVFLAGFLKYAPISLDGVPLTEDIAWRYTRVFFNRFPQVTAPSEAMRCELITHGVHVPITTISNGVDVELFAPAPRNQNHKPLLTLLHVGRLGYEKRVDQIIHTFALLANDFPKARLRIVGDGPEREFLQSLAVDLGVGDRVQFTGFVAHHVLPSIYQQADVFITTSTIETQGLVVLEAMASGLPVIGVNALALPELIQDSVNGFLVPHEDEKALYQATACMLSSPELRCSMGRSSRRLALKHSLSHIIHAYEQVYQQSLTQAPRSMLPHIPEIIDPAMAWSAFRAEGQAMMDTGAELVWEIIRILRWLSGKVVPPVIERVRKGTMEWRKP